MEHRLDPGTTVVAINSTKGSRRPRSSPVAYQVIFERGVGQFREFESPRVHYS